MLEIRESAWLIRYYRKAIVAAAATTSVLPIYALLAEILRSHGQSGLGADIPGVLLGAAVTVSLALLPTVGWLRRHMLGQGAGLHAVVDQAMVPQNRYERMVSATTISMMLCQVPASLGFVLVLLEAEKSDLYLFIGWSVILSAIYFPRYGQWQRWFAERSRFR